jgi:hypothetical protein
MVLMQCNSNKQVSLVLKVDGAVRVSFDYSPLRLRRQVTQSYSLLTLPNFKAFL